MAEQYGTVMALAAVPDDQVETTGVQLVSLAREWADFHKLRVVGDVEIIRHRDVSEPDWQMMKMSTLWQPGLEVWGWKMQAEREASNGPPT